MIVLIDNYDSFTYNVYQYLGQLKAKVRVLRNDKFDLATLERLKPSALVISPGPGEPKDAGRSLESITAFAGQLPILGICLGHQAIAEAFGGNVIRAKRQMHGKVSAIKHQKTGLFRGLPSPVIMARYHSLEVAREGLPRELKVTAEAEDGTIMAIQHRRWPIFGVQFHPESFASDCGLKMLENFVSLAEAKSGN